MSLFAPHTPARAEKPPTRIVSSTAAEPRRPRLMADVGEFSREQIALDEGIDYFAVQGALARARLLA